jgi:hypothetical protein
MLRSGQDICLYSNWLRPGRCRDRIPVGARFFTHVQTNTGAQPNSCTMFTGSFKEVKRPGRGADHPPLLAPRSRISGFIPPLHIWAFRACYSANFTYYVIKIIFRYSYCCCCCSALGILLHLTTATGCKTNYS